MWVLLIFTVLYISKGERNNLKRIIINWLIVWKYNKWWRLFVYLWKLLILFHISSILGRFLGLLCLLFSFSSFGQLPTINYYNLGECKAKGRSISQWCQLIIQHLELVLIIRGGLSSIIYILLCTSSIFSLGGLPSKTKQGLIPFATILAVR